MSHVLILVSYFDLILKNIQSNLLEEALVFAEVYINIGNITNLMLIFAALLKVNIIVLIFIGALFFANSLLKKPSIFSLLNIKIILGNPAIECTFSLPLNLFKFFYVPS